MEYENLSELIKNEKYGRAYFNSLPKSVQGELSNIGGTIHSTAGLHAEARNAEERIRREILAKREYT